MPKRGEKGFTLIELLIVVAILGVLAAVVIPNVSRFIGAGETEAAETELATIQAAVSAMMVDNEVSVLDPVTTGATDNMSLFPDITATLDSKGANTAFVTAAINNNDIMAEVKGYLLYGNQIVIDVDGDGEYDDGVDEIRTVNYVAQQITSERYTVDAYGTVSQE